MKSKFPCPFGSWAHITFLGLFLTLPFHDTYVLDSASQVWMQNWLRWGVLKKILMSKHHVSKWIRIAISSKLPRWLTCAARVRTTVLAKQSDFLCLLLFLWLPCPLHFILNRKRTYSSFWNSSTRLDFCPGDILAKMVPFISICKEPKREIVFMSAGHTWNN